MAERRILWLVKGLGLGGTERLLSVAAPLVADADTIVDVAYVLPWKDALVPALRESGIEVHCLGTGRGGVRAWPLRLARLLSTRHYDVVHTHSPVPAVVARLAPGARRAHFLHTEHSAWPRYRFPTRAANAATLGRNQAVWAVSEAVAASIRRPGWARWVRMPPVEVLYHGIDERQVRRGPEARAAAREVLGIAADRRIIGSVGNLAPKKDQATLLAAFEVVAADRPDLDLVLVGGGPLEGQLRAQAATLAAADRVHFLGQRPDVAQLMPGFDVFALSSRYEGLGLVLIEAMAAGIPVVATAVDGIPEVVRDGDDGLLVEPGDPAALAGGIARLLDDAPLAARLAEAGTVAAGRFSIGTAVKRMVQAYAADPAPTARSAAHG